MSHTLTLFKVSKNSLNPEVMKRQLNHALDRSLAGTRGKVWSGSKGKIQHTDQDDEHLYSSTLRFTRTGKAIKKDTEIRQLDRIKAIAERAVRSRGWTSDCLSSATIQPTVGEQIAQVMQGAPPAPSQVSAYASVKINVDPNAGYFSHLYNLDSQIELVLSAVQEYERSEFVNRFHCVLYGSAACISGTANVSVNRAGKSFDLSLKSLYLRFNGLPDFTTPGQGEHRILWKANIPTKIRTMSATGEIILLPVQRVLHKGRQITYTVKTNKREVRATADHEFFIGSGWSAVSALRVGDQIFVGEKKSVSAGKPWKRNHYREVGGLKGHPLAKTRGRVRESHLAVEAHMNGLSLCEYVSRIRKKQTAGFVYLSKNNVVHHIDENPQNNSQDNLEIKQRSRHSAEHGSERLWKNVVAKAVPEIITSIEKFGQEDVYDVALGQEPHNFLANDIVVHNCGKTEVLRSLTKMLGSDAVMHFDATSTTSAGAKQLLTESDKIPPVLCIEEIEKADEASLRWLLGVLDYRAEVRALKFRAGLVRRNVKLLCLATVNDFGLFGRMMDGALASRFSNKIYFPRPTREVLEKILEREIAKSGGDVAWIAPALDYCLDKEDTNDPRRIITVCLCGREKLLTGEYQKVLAATQAPKIK